jgi:hypothetical protein
MLFVVCRRVLHVALVGGGEICRDDMCLSGTVARFPLEALALFCRRLLVGGVWHLVGGDWEQSVNIVASATLLLAWQVYY